MRWPWNKPHRPDPAATARARDLEAKTRAAELQAHEAITKARESSARAHRHIRENHLGPLFADAFALAPREDR